MCGMFFSLRFPLNASVLLLRLLGKKSDKCRVVYMRMSRTELFSTVKNLDTT